MRRIRARTSKTMPKHYDTIVIDAGHNGLVTAFYLARAGFKPLVLERRAVVGGAAVTEEFHPGFRASVLDGVAGPLVPTVAKDMQLERHGVQYLEPKCRVFAPSPDARALILHSSAAESAKRIAPFSQPDAAKYVELAKIFADAQKFISSLLTIPPPDIDHPGSTDIWNLLAAGRKFRKLGKRDMRRFLRWGPMAVADFVAEFFETELLRAVIAARGIFGSAAGPWSAGTGSPPAARRRTRPAGRRPDLCSRGHGRAIGSHGRCREASWRGNSHLRRSRAYSCERRRHHWRRSKRWRRDFCCRRRFRRRSQAHIPKINRACPSRA